MTNSQSKHIWQKPLSNQTYDTKSWQFTWTKANKHPLLKGKYTGHEKTYFGDLDISPRLAETKRNQKKLDKSVLPIFLGGSRFPSGKIDPKMAVGGSRPHNNGQELY